MLRLAPLLGLMLGCGGLTNVDLLDGGLDADGQADANVQDAAVDVTADGNAIACLDGRDCSNCAPPTCGDGCTSACQVACTPLANCTVSTREMSDAAVSCLGPTRCGFPSTDDIDVCEAPTAECIIFSDEPDLQVACTAGQCRANCQQGCTLTCVSQQCRLRCAVEPCEIVGCATEVQRCNGGEIACGSCTPS
ncbi:MAG: hypothetical protein AAGF12_30215 [Myxococcota bacterium]